MPERGARLADVTASFAIPAASPFHLEATVRVLQRRPTNRVNLWEGGRYWRVLSTDDGLRLAAVENRGAIDTPDLRGLVFGGPISPRTREQLVATVQRLLGPAVDVAPFYHAARCDARLQAAIASLRGLKPPRFPTLFETFTNVIPFQQVSWPLAMRRWGGSSNASASACAWATGRITRSQGQSTWPPSMWMRCEAWD